MSKIRITMTIDPEYADDSHPMGVTEAGYDALSERLGDMGTDIDVAAEPS
jgi:hypothetical protein